MKLPFLKYSFFSLSILISASQVRSYSQQLEKTIIKGTVLEAGTDQPLPFVSVILKNSTVGTVTDNNGKYLIETTIKAPVISFSFVGYESVTRPVIYGQYQVIDVKLKEASYQIKEVIVKPKKQPYSNKNNPAVDLIEKVIEKKSENRKEGFDYVKYDKYEKTQFSLTKITEKDRQSFMFRKYQFLLENADSTKQKGMQVLPFFMKESLSTYYYRKNPTDSKEIIRGEKTINFDEYMDSKGVTSYLHYLYQNLNIYDNEILFLTNKFLSPISKSAPLFYRYYIIDTVQLSDVKCIRLFFDARNKADFLFQGFLFVTQDSTYAVRKVDMNLNRGINIDWIKNVKIVQEFVQTKKKTWMLSRDDVSMNFEIFERIKGVFGERTVSYSNYVLNEPADDSIFKGQVLIRNLDPNQNTSEYWEKNRIIPLSRTEQGIYKNVDSLMKMRSFKRLMDFIMLLTTDFYTFKKTEFGPLGNFYSFNTIEGPRLRFGGRTTPGFSKKITLDGYLAYAFKDNKPKYFAALTYSLTPRTIYQFPVKSIMVSYQNDTRTPGQELQFAQGDNLLLSFKRGVDDKLMYYKTLKTELFNEFENHFSYTLGYRYSRQSPAGNLFYNKIDYLDTINNIAGINNSEGYLTLRYAPNEEFYQGKLYRDAIPSRYPVIQLKLAFGSRSLNNDFNYTRIQLSMSKRFYPSIIGYSNVIVEAGKIFGQVPYPLLFMHRANQTYSYQADSYNLMNFLEFVSDQYASLNIDYSFNGFLFNKVPFLKKLKLREIVTLKVLYGNISNQNNPDLNSNLYKLPVDRQTFINSGSILPLTYSLDRKPYIEAGVGVSNILKIFRVDLVKRFTYTNNPNVSNIGIRVQFRFDI